MSGILTTHGYAVLKSSLTKEQEEKIKKDLTKNYLKVTIRKKKEEKVKISRKK